MKIFYYPGVSSSLFSVVLNFYATFQKFRLLDLCYVVTCNNLGPNIRLGMYLLSKFMSSW